MKNPNIVGNENSNFLRRKQYLYLHCSSFQRLKDEVQREAQFLHNVFYTFLQLFDDIFINLSKIIEKHILRHIKKAYLIVNKI